MYAQSCAIYIRCAHEAASSSVVPPPRTEKGVNKNYSAVENDDEILVAPSQNAMTTTCGTHHTVWSPKRAPALCAGERASALCAGERGVSENATLRGTHLTVRSPKRAPARCTGECAPALCAGECGVGDDATPGARFTAVPPRADTQGVSTKATPGARECVLHDVDERGDHGCASPGALASETPPKGYGRSGRANASPGTRANAMSPEKAEKRGRVDATPSTSTCANAVPIKVQVKSGPRDAPYGALPRQGPARHPVDGKGRRCACTARGPRVS